MYTKARMQAPSQISGDYVKLCLADASKLKYCHMRILFCGELQESDPNQTERFQQKFRRGEAPQEAQLEPWLASSAKPRGTTARSPSTRSFGLAVLRQWLAAAGFGRYLKWGEVHVAC